ncbi:hypothetical protein Tco_0745065 [Tanacetum coccineum]
MHNDIMAAGSKERLPMLATGRYAQWQSHFLRYVDMKSNKKELKKYPSVPEHTVLETYENTLPENHAYIDAEAKAINMILSGIGDDIYSTIDACTTAKEIDKESIESYYSRFYKMMNEMVRNQLEVSLTQVNVQFLQQLKPEWSRFVTDVKQIVDLDKESPHKLFDILKQNQNEVNEIYAIKLAKNAKPLALVAVVQHYPEYHNQAPKPHKPIASSSRQITSSKSHATTRSKGKEVVKPVTPPSESASNKDSDEEQAQRDKQI